MAGADEPRAETVPLFGARAAGKTRLLAAIMLLMLRNATRHRLPAEPADPATARASRVFGEILRTGGHVASTAPETPVAYLLRLGSGRTQRTLRLFDAAGERFAAVERTDELEYFRTARSLLFVLDPLSVAAFRDTLRPGTWEKIDWSLASPESPGPVFDQTVQTVLQMGAELRRTRLAVAVTKTDLFQAWGSAPVRSPDPAACERWLSEEMGLGNLVRSARHQFGQVQFFFTSATLSASGDVDPSISALSSWLLGEDRLPRHLRRLVQ